MTQYRIDRPNSPETRHLTLNERKYAEQFSMAVTEKTIEIRDEIVPSQISDDRLDWRELFLKANDALTTFIFIYFFCFSRLSVRCNFLFELSSRTA